MAALRRSGTLASHLREAKVAVISGVAAGGIGEAIASRFISEGTAFILLSPLIIVSPLTVVIGYTVFGLDIVEPQLSRITFIHTDIRDPSQIEQAVRQAQNRDPPAS